MHNPEYALENETHELLWNFKIQTDHLISAKRPDLVTVNKEKGTYRIEDFAVLADNRVKLKERENKNKYLDLARELKKLWHIKVTLLPVLQSGTVTKRLVKGQEESEIRGQVETIEITA